jgi:HNH endonuclease
MSNNSYAYTKINGKKIRVHRQVMEEHLGRLLQPNEHVYHLNGDGRDNNIENLVVIKKKVTSS